MKRTAVFVLFMAFLLSACIPGLPTQQAVEEPLPTVDAQATNESMAATGVAETLSSLPTPTQELPTDTPQPTSTPTEVVAFTATETATTNPNATIPPPTSCSPPNDWIPITVQPSDTLAILAARYNVSADLISSANCLFSTDLPTGTILYIPPIPTPTETLHVRFYGTLPPAIPYSKVKLINRSKAEAYISLQCSTIDGYKTILEYPVGGKLKVSAPVGQYTYVAWVGGRQFQGRFGLGRNEEVEITLYKDKVTIK